MNAIVFCRRTARLLFFHHLHSHCPYTPHLQKIEGKQPFSLTSSRNAITFWGAPLPSYPQGIRKAPITAKLSNLGVHSTASQNTESRLDQNKFPSFLPYTLQSDTALKYHSVTTFANFSAYSNGCWTFLLASPSTNYNPKTTTKRAKNILPSVIGRVEAASTAETKVEELGTKRVGFMVEGKLGFYDRYHNNKDQAQP